MKPTRAVSKKKNTKHSDLRPASELAPAFKRLSARHNAKPHLVAFKYDGDERHLIAAALEYAALGVPLPPVELDARGAPVPESLYVPKLQAALWKEADAGVRSKTTALRDAEIARFIIAKHGTLPNHVQRGTWKEVVRQFGVDVDAAKQAFKIQEVSQRPRLLPGASLPKVTET